MRSKIMQCTIRMIVALGIAVAGVIAIRDVVAYSSASLGNQEGDAHQPFAIPEFRRASFG